MHGFLRMKSIDVPLIGLMEAAILPLGIVELPLCLGETPIRAMLITTFMVIN